MKALIKTFYLISFLIFSCTSAQVKPTYVKNYGCIETYLKLKGVKAEEPDILIHEKIGNIQTLRVFNGGTGIVHSDENYTPKLYNKEHWGKLYKKYINDTIVKYWEKEDFPTINFVFGTQKKALYDGFLDMYVSTTKDIICLSEPIYYVDNKYVMFYYSKSPKGLFGYGENLVVIMKMENG